jgi:FkbM family methyltransferase
MYQAHGWWFPAQDTHFAEMLGKNIQKGGGPVYQEPVRHRSIGFAKKGVALDVGANVGLWTKDLCKNFNKVIAFEPVDKFRDCLMRNVTADNLEIKTCALGAEDTMINMIVTAENTGHSHVDASSHGNGYIPMFKLDSLDLEPFDYMKIDCEGYEYNILLGAEQTIKKYKPVVVVEQKLHKDTGRTENNQYQAAELLKSWGARQLARVNHDVILGW